MERPIKDEIITVCLDAGQELDKTRVYLDELEIYTNHLESKVKEYALLPIVKNSEVFEHYCKPFTNGRDLWDFIIENYDLIKKNL